MQVEKLRYYYAALIAARGCTFGGQTKQLAFGGNRKNKGEIMEAATSCLCQKGAKNNRRASKKCDGDETGRRDCEATICRTHPFVEIRLELAENNSAKVH